MITLNALKAYGADTAEGLSRCMNNEMFYLRLVGMMADDPHTAQLRQALDSGNLTAAFEAAHALKGVLSNLALTPALRPVSEITEHLRAREAMDYNPLCSQVEEQINRLTALIRG